MDFITNHLGIWTSALLNKSTAGRGGNGKQEAYGIKKLRELILELAVRGKLVPQDSNDEPACVLLRKIVEERDRLAREGKIKKPKELPEIKDDEEPFALPNGWEYVRLNDLGDWGAGATPLRGRHDYYGGDIPWFKSGELVGNYISESEEHVTRLALKETSLRYNKPGDVLIAMYGATIGKTSILKVAATTNQAVCACTPSTGFTNVFLLTLLKAFKHRFIDMGAGGAQPNISREKIIATVIALPPTEEQHRIVAKVDELMALCDQLEQQQTDNIATHQTLVETLLGTLAQAADAQAFAEAWSRIADHFDTLFTTEHSIDQLKQTILQIAVMGKLVPQDSNDEPADLYLKRVAEEKQRLIDAKQIQKPKKLPSIDDDAMPFLLPKGWKWAYVWDVAKIITSGSRDWAKYYSNTGALFVTMGNLSRGDYKLRLDSLRYVNPPVDGEGSRTRLEANDLLISITGDVGNLGLIPDNFGEAYINQHTCLLRFMPDCQSRYFPELMRSPWAKYQFDAPQRGVKNSFRLSDIGEMLIPVPPDAEQHRIVAKVDELMALCDALKERIKNAQTTQIHLADAIVEQAVA